MGLAEEREEQTAEKMKIPRNSESRLVATWKEAELGVILSDESIRNEKMKREHLGVGANIFDD